MEENTQNMTQGKILQKLVMFALPLLGSSLIQQLYNTADMLFVGNFAGKTGAAAVGSSGLIFTCLIGLFTGISVGVGIVIAHAWGAGDRKLAQRTAQTAMTVGFLGSAVLMLIGLVAARRILVLMRTPESILEEAASYVRIYFLSMIPMVLYNMGASILRAEGNSKLPFYILIGGGLTNILMDALLVAVFGFGSCGAAAATSISQTVSAVCMLWYLTSERTSLRICICDFHIDCRILAKILNYGLPAGIQSVVVTLSNIVVQYYINGYGEDAVAAFAAYFKIEGIIYLPIVAFGQAVTTFSGQNYGAGLYKRIKKGTREGILLSSVVAGVTALFAVFSAEQLVRLFIQDESVVRYGVRILQITFPVYWLYSVLEVTGASLRGMGYSRSSMIVVLTGLCGFRILLLFVLGVLKQPFSALVKVYPATWFLTAAVFVVIFETVMRKRISKA